MTGKKSVNLINLEENQKVIIDFIMAGSRAAKRLADLGLTPETPIKILRKAPFWGPVEIEVRGSKIVLGRGLAAKILVHQI